MIYLNIEWLKNKLGEKFYPITHVGSVLCGNSNETLETKLVTLDENAELMQANITTNLLKPTLETTTKNGVTCTNNGDGTYTLDGTAVISDSNYNTFSIRINITLQPGTYKIIGTKIKRSDSYITVYTTAWKLIAKEVEYNSSFTLSEETSLNICYYFENGSSFDNVLIKPMLTTNLSATYDDFVPFTGTTGKLNGDVAELEKSNEGKMNKENPTGTGAFSMNRKADTTVGENSTAEGTDCIASKKNSHAEGFRTTASGIASHAEGFSATASGNASHAEGYGTTSSGDYCHAEGYGTTASGNYCHAEGYGTTASGDYCNSFGMNTVAKYFNQTVFGKFNENKAEDIIEIGNGTDSSSRSNALELTDTGDLTLGGDCTFTDANGNKISMRSILTRLAALEPGFSVDVGEGDSGSGS